MSLSAANKEDTTTYIRSFWDDLTGDKVELVTQTFDSTTGGGETYPGINYILVVKGASWATAADRPIVLGSHYDSVHATAGMPV